MGSYDEALAAFRSGDNDRAGELSHGLLSSARASGDAGGQVDGLCMLSRIALRNNRLDEVEAYARAAHSVAMAAGEARLERMPLHMLAVAARMGGDRATARRLYQESIELNRSLGEERMVAAELHNLAYVELHDGDLARARHLFQQARAEARRLGYHALSPYLVADRAVLAAEDCDFARAATLLGAAQAAFDAVGQAPDPDDAAEHEQLGRRLAAQLGEDRLAALRREGARASIEDALDDE